MFSRQVRAPCVSHEAYTSCLAEAGRRYGDLALSKTLPLTGFACQSFFGPSFSRHNLANLRQSCKKFGYPKACSCLHFLGFPRSRINMLSLWPPRKGYVGGQEDWRIFACCCREYSMNAGDAGETQKCQVHMYPLWTRRVVNIAYTLHVYKLCRMSFLDDRAGSGRYLAVFCHPLFSLMLICTVC